MTPLVLASASPRRKTLLDSYSIPFEVVVSGVSEETEPGTPAAEAIAVVARRKACAVAARTPPGVAVLAADTGVVVDELLFGKPADEADAARMLGVLSGRWHSVVTAVALAVDGVLHEVSVHTRVKFAELGPAEIEWYVATGEPMDKAGGYGVQGLGAALVKEVNGSYTNVVGLPLAETFGLLEKVGHAPWSELKGR